MSDDLMKRLSLLADSIELGDKLRWGEDSAALREAKDSIEELEAKNKELKAKISEMFDAAQQVHKDGGRELARLATEAYDHD